MLEETFRPQLISRRVKNPFHFGNSVGNDNSNVNLSLTSLCAGVLAEGEGGYPQHFFLWPFPFIS